MLKEIVQRPFSCIPKSVFDRPVSVLVSTLTVASVANSERKWKTLRSYQIRFIRLILEDYDKLILQIHSCVFFFFSSFLRVHSSLNPFRQDGNSRYRPVSVTQWCQLWNWDSNNPSRNVACGNDAENHAWFGIFFFESQRLLALQDHSSCCFKIGIKFWADEPIVPIDLLYQFSERQAQTCFCNTSTGTSCLRTTVTFLYLRGLRDHWHSQDEGDAHSNDFRAL